MIIFYDDKNITNLFLNSDIIEIPNNKRKLLFGGNDNNLNNIIITDDYDNTTTYNDKLYIKLMKDENGKFKNDNIDHYYKLLKIHDELIFKKELLFEEFPEQLMGVKFIDPNSCVLEIGANIGRNSCVIGKILNDSSKLLVFEPHYETVNNDLVRNRDNNNLKFRIENGTISNYPLVQHYWNTKRRLYVQEPGWTPINTLTWSEVKQKYNDMNFDTLVLDCEGYIYNIVVDEPDFFNNFKTIIIENDFKNLDHKLFINNSLLKFNFVNVYREPGGFQPCYGCFYETWIKK